MIKRSKWLSVAVMVCIFATSIFSDLPHNHSMASARTKKSAKFLSVKIGNKNGMKQTFALLQGSTLKLTVVTKPAKAKNSVTFRSGNKNIATVSKNGTIKGIHPGTVKIKVKLSGKYKKKTTWVKINVMKLVFDKPVTKVPTPTPGSDSKVKLLYPHISG